MAKKKSKGKKALIIIIVVVAILGALVFYFLNKAKQNSGPTFNTVVCEEGTIEVNVNGSGSIESYDEESIYVSYTSEVKDVLVENGDIVKKGDVIAYLESDSLDSAILNQKTIITALERKIKYMNVESSTQIQVNAKGRVKKLYIDKMP